MCDLHLVPPEHGHIRELDAPIWSDWLPHVVHVVSCAGVTIACAVLVPFDSLLVLTLGVISTALTHFLLATVHGSLDAADDVAS